MFGVNLEFYKGCGKYRCFAKCFPVYLTEFKKKKNAYIGYWASIY